MKKSLAKALASAKIFSINHPDKYVRVMDKEGSDPVINMDSEFFPRWKEKGFRTVAAFVRGKEQMI